MAKLGQFNFDGSAVPGRAFGMSLCDQRSSSGADYLFQIVPHGNGQLELTIDVYTAFYFSAAPDVFDVDLWEDLKHRYIGPATREGFYALSRAARTLLAGDTIDINGGIRCIAGAMTAAAEEECFA